MPDTTRISADQVHFAIRELRGRAEILPEKIELGIAQREAIEAEVRAAAGTDDIGPLTSYMGLEIITSRKHDHVRLLAAGESGDDVEVGQVQSIAPSGPDAPVESGPSGD
jgi:hypothetical protein